MTTPTDPKPAFSSQVALTIGIATLKGRLEKALDIVNRANAGNLPALGELARAVTHLPERGTVLLIPLPIKVGAAIVSAGDRFPSAPGSHEKESEA